MSKKLTYQNAGVDPEKAAKLLQEFGQGLKASPNVLSGVGPFAACYDLKDIVSKMESPVLVTSCDGVGTKVKLAVQWENLEPLGQDLVAMSVNDLLCLGASPLVFLDYYATSFLDDTQLLTLLRSIQRGCELGECALVGGETAEMPGLYKEREFDLAGFCVGMADRANLLGPAKIKEGDCLIAVESSGIHSNGFSLIRRLVERESLDPNAKTPFSDETWKEALLKPTHIYTKAVKGITKELHAIAHITGGGLFENLPRLLPEGMNAEIDSSKWKFPPLFQWIQQEAKLTDNEMLSTFNCGVGLILAAPKNHADKVMEHVSSQGFKCWEVGSVKGAGKRNVEWK